MEVCVVMSFYVVVYSDPSENIAYVQCSDLPIERPCIQDESLTRYSLTIAGDYTDAANVYPNCSIKDGTVSVSGFTVKHQERMSQ